MVEKSMGEKSVRTRGRVVARAGGPNAAARDNAPMAKMDRIVLQWVAAGGLGSYVDTPVLRAVAAMIEFFDAVTNLYQLAARGRRDAKAGLPLLLVPYNR